MADTTEREKPMEYLVHLLHENADRGVCDEVPVPLGRLLEILYAWQAAEGKDRGVIQCILTELGDEATPSEYAQMVEKAERAETQMEVATLLLDTRTREYREATVMARRYRDQRDEQEKKVLVAENSRLLSKKRYVSERDALTSEIEALRKQAEN